MRRAGRATGIFIWIVFSTLHSGCKPERPALPVAIELAQMLPVAESFAGTTFIDFGTRNAIPHLAIGWSGSENHNTGEYIWSEGSHSTLRLQLGAPRDLNLKLRCWPFDYPGAPSQSMKVLVNGHPNGIQKLVPGPQVLRLHIPSSRLHSGENWIDFQYAFTRQPMDVLPGSTDLRNIAVAWDWLEVPGSVAYEGPSASAGGRLTLPGNSSISFAIQALPGSVLTMNRIRVREAGATARLVVLLQAATDPTPRRLSFLPQETPLELPLAGHSPIRISFVAEDYGNTGRPLHLEIDHPAVRSKPAPKGTPAARESRSVEGPPRPNILLYLVDTLRADHLGCYGYSRPTSPHIDQLAADGVLFQNAEAQSSWTRASVASIFTSLPPQLHRVNDEDEALNERLLTLAEILQEEGYQTAGIVANRNVGSRFGFHQGFDYYEQRKVHIPTPSVHMLSDQVTESVLRWMTGMRNPGKPFFMYLHTVDPHGPYTPRSPFRERFERSPIPKEVGSLQMLDELNLGVQHPPPRLKEQLVDLYDAEIAFNDEYFGRLISYLKQQDLYDSTWIIFVSDHGEEFDDHGRWSHGITLFEEQVHVPLIMKFPQSRGAGKRVSRMVRQIDIAPTILDQLGLTSPPQFQGMSIRGLAEGRSGTGPEWSYAYLKLSGRRMDSLRDNTRKMIRYFEYDRPRPAIEMYNLTRDPKEEENTAIQDPVWRTFLFSLLQESATAWKPLVPLTVVDVDPELRQELDALGYVKK